MMLAGIKECQGESIDMDHREEEFLPVDFCFLFFSISSEYRTEHIVHSGRESHGGDRYECERDDIHP
jgi:hypothetical protein